MNITKYHKSFDEYLDEINPIIKIGADANWPPFEYVDSSGNYQGIASEYLNLITKYTGLQFEVNADNWYNTISKTKNKELDMLACVAKTADREEYLDFTLPFLSIDVVVIAKKELQIKNFDEIKNYKIAVQKGNFVYENLIKKYPNIEFIFATSIMDLGSELMNEKILLLRVS